MDPTVQPTPSPAASSSVGDPLLAPHIEYTLLRPGCTRRHVDQLCAQAVAAQYFGVCVPSCFVAAARQALSGSSLRVITVVGFPFGYANLPSKRYETEQALRDGADELDLVPNHSLLRSAQLTAYRGEVHLIARLVQAAGRTLKLIVEPSLLTPEELEQACQVCCTEGVHVLKTSSGFVDAPATPELITQLRALLPPGFPIKASGGIRTAEQAHALLRAGATRLGTSAPL